MPNFSEQPGIERKDIPSTESGEIGQEHIEPGETRHFLTEAERTAAADHVGQQIARTVDVDRKPIPVPNGTESEVKLDLPPDGATDQQKAAHLQRMITTGFDIKPGKPSSKPNELNEMLDKMIG